MYFYKKVDDVEVSLEYAVAQDAEDGLQDFRSAFCIPQVKGEDAIYLCGNSLGLMPTQTPLYVNQELEDWKNLGVEGHLHARHPWLPYHEFLTNAMARVVGALPSEVVVMNSLTVNLHLMMVSFFRPTGKRTKILFDYSPFPSDRYAIASQLRYHGLDPEECMIELAPDPQGDYVSAKTIRETLESRGHEIALILIGGVNYYTGQAYDLGEITRLGHQHGCLVGFDLAHAAGNLRLQLHDDGPDFAVWCTYKYLNSGPGSLSGCFIHERHHENRDLPRFEGWWGHDKQSRFLMGATFEPMPTAEAWQMSNPPILSMAAIRASLDLFDKAGMASLRQKSEKLTAYLFFLVNHLEDEAIRVITPEKPGERGCQVSLQMLQPNKDLFAYLTNEGVVADWREPDVIRVAPVPFYNTFQDVWHFYTILKKGLTTLH